MKKTAKKATENSAKDQTQTEASAKTPIELPTIRQMARALRNRVEDVMAKSGRRPGDLMSLSNDLAALQSLDIPLMDSTD